MHIFIAGGNTFPDNVIGIFIDIDNENGNAVGT